MVVLCKACGKDMNASAGCNCGEIFVDGIKYDRIKVAAENDLFGKKPKGFRCHDCNSEAGHFHHWNCDAERCPSCGLQLLSCDCGKIYVEVEKKKTR